jgi:MSHA biogenesis protein MshO
MAHDVLVRSRHCSGFTLVEMIMVIVITGIIASFVGVFIKGAIDAYVDSARRAELSDVADTAVRRISRDIHLALPNSVRNPEGGGDLDKCVEFMPTKIGARYRAAKESAVAGDELDFSVADSSFDMLWLNSALPTTMQIVPGDVAVVYNDGSGKSDCTGTIPSEVGGNAYCGYNAIEVASVGTEGATGTPINFVGTLGTSPFKRKQLPAESPYYRFQVIPSSEHVVAYVCRANKLYRHSRTLLLARPLPLTCSTMVTDIELATAPILAENVSCSFKYEPPGTSTGLSRNGILQISLTVSDQTGENVKLYHQVHVDNTP